MSKKLVLVISSFLVFSFTSNAQNVANTYWQAYDTTNSADLYWYFDADTCWFSSNGIDYDSVSVFTETAGQFFITDIYYPGPNYCGGTGVYNKMFSVDTMWLIPVTDTCPTRPEYFMYHYFIGLGSGISEQHSSAMVSIYPNPNSGTFTITTSEEIESVTVRDIWGKITAAVFSSQHNSIRLTDQASGVYFITIQHRNGATTTEKIVVEN